MSSRRDVVVIGGGVWAMAGYTAVGQVQKDGAWTIDELDAQKATLFADHEPVLPEMAVASW